MLLAALPFNLQTNELYQSRDTYVSRAEELFSEGAFEKVRRGPSVLARFPSFRAPWRRKKRLSAPPPPPHRLSSLSGLFSFFLLTPNYRNAYPGPLYLALS